MELGKYNCKLRFRAYRVITLQFSITFIDKQRKSIDVKIQITNTVRSWNRWSGRGCCRTSFYGRSRNLAQRFCNDTLNDSKVFNTPLKRDLLRPLIETNAMTLVLPMFFLIEIDKKNILNASFLPCIKPRPMTTTPKVYYCDGNQVLNPYKNIPHCCIVKGDANTSASQQASFHCQNFTGMPYMEKNPLEYPKYNWKKNKVTLPKEHMEALSRKYGNNKIPPKNF